MPILINIFGSAKRRHYILLIVVVLLTYWPLTFGIYSLKNDAFIYFLPWRFHISESIQNGYFPFWNPYLYTGLPIYSDMQSGAWDPVVLIISLLTRYNMQVLQWELLLYLGFGGIGMYKLIKETGGMPLTSFIGAISYICCGFITDSGSFIPWITCAGYLPFALLYFYRLLKQPSFFLSAKFSIILFLLLTAGNPSFLIYTGYIFMAAFIYWILKNDHSKLKVIAHLFISLFLFLILSLPVILSFLDFLPYYKRGSGASLQESLTDPFNLFCSISYLFPSAVAKPHEWFHTDVAMRNAYIGIFTIGFFFYALFLPYNRIKKFIVCVIIFSFLFSLGDATPLREWCYQFLPFMNTFRHPAIARLFTSIGIILLSAQGLNSFIAENDGKSRSIIIKVMAALMIITGGVVAYYFMKYNFPETIKKNNTDVKSFIDQLTLPQLVVIQGSIQLLFISFFLFLAAKKRNVIALMPFNLIFFAMMALPFSFISQTKTKDINRYLNSFPSGYPLPNLSYPLISKNDSSFGIDFSDYNKFYNKQITIQQDIISPTVSTSYLSFLSHSNLLDFLQHTSFATLSSPEGEEDSNATLLIKKFSPTQFDFIATTEYPGYLTLFQQFHHNWKVFINDIAIRPETAFTAFMKVKIPAGKSTVSFKYKPGGFLIVAMLISWTILVALSGLTIFYYYRNYKIKWRNG